SRRRRNRADALTSPYQSGLKAMGLKVSECSQKEMFSPLHVKSPIRQLRQANIHGMEPEQPAGPFRFTDPRQERIYRRLRTYVGPGPAEFYRDACRLIAMPGGLATTTHLVAHLLREIESALRDVLETVADGFAEAVQEAKRKNKVHKGEI